MTKLNRTRIAILIALLALGITLASYLFILFCAFLGLYSCTPPQAATVYIIILPVGMSVAFVSLLLALILRQRERAHRVLKA